MANKKNKLKRLKKVKKVKSSKKAGTFKKGKSFSKHDGFKNGTGFQKRERTQRSEGEDNQASQEKKKSFKKGSDFIKDKKASKKRSYNSDFDSRSDDRRGRSNWRDGNNDERRGRSNWRDGNNDERRGRSNWRDGNNDERRGRSNWRDGNNDDRRGRSNWRDGNNDERRGRSNWRDGNNDERRGRSNWRDGNNDERRGRSNWRDGNNDERRGRSNWRDGNNDDRRGRSNWRDGNNDERRGRSNWRDGNNDDRRENRFNKSNDYKKRSSNRDFETSKEERRERKRSNWDNEKNKGRGNWRNKNSDDKKSRFNKSDDYKKRKKNNKIKNEQKALENFLLDEDRIDYNQNVSESVIPEAVEIPPKSNYTPESDVSFVDLPISNKLKDSLFKMGYFAPTPIQEQTIPLVMNGHDILATSQTGTGKTGAFLIPIISMLETQKDESALIVTPTRELAKQVQTFANQMMGGHQGANSVLLIGGSDMVRQLRQLRKNPRLVIGTPGRINDHLKRKSLSLKKTHYLVLDETDRMLDMGFSVQINEILTHMSGARQTLLFSATLPKAIMNLAKEYLNNPERISIGGRNAIADKITQNIVNTEDKFESLLSELKKTQGSVLVFVRTRRNAEKLGKKLNDNYDYKAASLHGDLRQSKRERVMKDFRNKKNQILIATDVASRGLDVPHIEYVINYDVPDQPEDYIHRIGRTARAEKSGIAISFISKKEKRKWNDVQNFINGNEEKISAQKKPARKRRSFKGKARGHGNKNNNSTKRHH
jgi:superfamily II DNA/RNA helicase